MVVFYLYSLVVSYNRPKFDHCSSWNPNGVTFADENSTGINPFAIFVDIKNTVYVTAHGLDVIQIWVKGNSIPTNNISYEPFDPHSLFVTINEDIYIDNGLNRRIEKCSMNTTNCTVVMYVQKSCYGIFVDPNDNIYCSMMSSHQVIKKAADNDLNTSASVAGNGTQGFAANMLNHPSGIFVNNNLDLYVADTVNNRIQQFVSGQLNGTTVAGREAGGTIELNQPHGVLLDAEGFLFILDNGNNRIVGSGPNGFRCLVGCYGMGSGSSQLNYPTTISFDSYGNMFVADWRNSRIQKFLLTSNSCGKCYDFGL